MPRPKKPGGPEPKRRSRNGCWPCKGRKVKCDETRPSCMNCQRQGETCDYSIRLNWEGRGRKRADEQLRGSGQLVFETTTTLANAAAPVKNERAEAAPPRRTFGIGESSTFTFGPSSAGSPFVGGGTPSVSPGVVQANTSCHQSSFQSSVPNPQSVRSHDGRPQQPSQTYNTRPGASTNMIDPSLAMAGRTTAGTDRIEYAPGRYTGPVQQYATSYDREAGGMAPVQQYTTRYDREAGGGMAPTAPMFGQQPALSRLRESGLPSPSSVDSTSPKLPPNAFPSNNTAPRNRIPHMKSPPISSNMALESVTIPGATTSERPPKRRYTASPRESNQAYDAEMPPPHHVSSVSSFDRADARATGMMGGTGVGSPLTPAASSNGDDSYKSYSSKALSPYVASSHDSPELRRLSVNSLLSGPPPPGAPLNPSGPLNVSNHSYSPLQSPHIAATPDPSRSIHQGKSVSLQRSSSSVHEEEEYIIYGLDRGFKDLDIGKNDDMNAVSGSSPVIGRGVLASVEGGEGRIATEFGFGIQAKDSAFEKGGYYAKPVTIRIPRSLHPLPGKLVDNPINLLYFHHFLNHTARVLTPHDCDVNPFRNVLPRMALQDGDLLNLLLAYSASHRSRLLQHPEPATRIALWVRDIFPKLRHALNDPNKIVSNANLATAIMLASLEIISPNAFGIAIPWQQHLDVARQMIAVRGGASTMAHDEVSSFLLRWFAYLDVVGSLSGGRNSPPLSAASSPTGRKPSYKISDYGPEKEDVYKIDCLLGFTSRCISILAKIANVARVCDRERIGPDHAIRPDWRPSPSIIAQAQQMKQDLHSARANTSVEPCPHRHSSSSDSDDSWDTIEMQATNEAYHWAGICQIDRRILGKASSHSDVQTAVTEIVNALGRVRKGSTAEACLLFPIFTAGCEAQGERHRQMVLERLESVGVFGMAQVGNAVGLMRRVWREGRPWETFVQGEFLG